VLKRLCAETVRPVIRDFGEHGVSDRGWEMVWADFDGFFEGGGKKNERF
jgi:hypothetical protein